MRLILNDCKILQKEYKKNWKGEECVTVHIFRDGKLHKVNNVPVDVANEMEEDTYKDIPVKISCFAVEKGKGYLVLNYEA